MPYACFLGLAAVLLIGLTIYSWQRRSAPGANFLALLAFVILLPETSLGAVLKVADQLRAAMAHP